jgi:hypothetical protein
MILVLAVALAILIALVTGGSLKRLATVPFKHGWLAFLAVGLQVAAVYAQSIQGMAPVLFVLSYAILIGLVMINRRLAGMAIVGLGLGLNTVVTVANGGYMPVTKEAIWRAGLTHLTHELQTGARILGAKDIILSQSETSLWFLSDIFVLRGPWPTVFSIGDVVLAIGVLVFFYQAMRTQSLRTEAGRSQSLNEVASTAD